MNHQIEQIYHQNQMNMQACAPSLYGFGRNGLNRSVIVIFIETNTFYGITSFFFPFCVNYDFLVMCLLPYRMESHTRVFNFDKKKCLKFTSFMQCGEIENTNMRLQYDTKCIDTRY